MNFRKIEDINNEIELLDYVILNPNYNINDTELYKYLKIINILERKELFENTNNIRYYDYLLSCKKYCNMCNISFQTISKDNWNIFKNTDYKIIQKIRAFISNHKTRIINKIGYISNKEFKEYFGCTQEQFKEHIDKQLENGMDWNNYGKWVIDHINPISKINNDNFKKIIYYKNLQPIWDYSNRWKYNKTNIRYY